MRQPVMVRLQGGLGNQLFQYAAALNLARARHCAVQVYGDEAKIALLEGTLGENLTRATSRVKLAVPAVLRQKETAVALRMFVRTMNALASSRSNAVVQFPAVAHLPPAINWGRLATSRRPVAMDGYFQHCDYGGSAVTEVARQLANRIDLAARRAQTIGVALRRGDYVSLGHHLAPSFYLGALEAIDPQRTRSVLVTSDDRLAAEALVGRHAAAGWSAEIVAPSTNTEHDLFALAGCQHLIMSNSTYSWWAAAIGDVIWNGCDRNVMMPDPWISGKSRPAPLNDWRLLPALFERDDHEI